MSLASSTLPLVALMGLIAALIWHLPCNCLAPLLRGPHFYCLRSWPAVLLSASPGVPRLTASQAPCRGNVSKTFLRHLAVKPPIF